MESLPLWIGQHALMLWALTLILALLVGDACWRRAHRRHLRAADERRWRALRPRTAAVLMALFAVLFALLYRAVCKQSALIDFDAALAQSLHDRLSPPLLKVVAILTNIGKPALLGVAGALIAGLLALRRNWRMCVPWCAALGGAMVSGELAKHIIKRPRPFDGHAFVVETGYSFPSGHALMSMVFFGMLAWLLLRALLPRHHRVAVAVAIGLITFVGISRVVLQAHYLSDVLAGYALGAFWLVLGIGMAESMRQDALFKRLS